MTPEVAAVKRGAKLLDTFVPGWAKKIDLRKFNLGDPSMCVLGQVHGDFCNGLRELVEDALMQHIKTDVMLEDGRMLTESVANQELNAAHYGFSSAGETNEEWERLGTQWTREILKRNPRAKR